MPHLVLKNMQASSCWHVVEYGGKQGIGKVLGYCFPDTELEHQQLSQIFLTKAFKLKAFLSLSAVVTKDKKAFLSLPHKRTRVLHSLLQEHKTQMACD